MYIRLIEMVESSLLDMNAMIVERIARRNEVIRSFRLEENFTL
jgi:hypothetical protein